MVIKIKQSAGLAGAAALRGFIQASRLPGVEKLRGHIKGIEITEEVMHWVKFEDFEEYEVGHDLARGTFAHIFKSLLSDYAANRSNSPLKGLRTRLSETDDSQTLISAEDLHELAANILNGQARIKGIGPARAQLLLDATELAIVEPDLES